MLGASGGSGVMVGVFPRASEASAIALWASGFLGMGENVGGLISTEQLHQ